MRIWFSRLLVGAVLFMNVECALAFLIAPQDYAAGFELPGVVGEGMVRGMGVLFLMWNVPYVFAALHPQCFRVSLYQAVIMQAIGVVGESAIWVSLPAAHVAARSSIMRFIIFDGGGLLALLLAAGMILSTRDRFYQPGVESSQGIE